MAAPDGFCANYPREGLARAVGAGRLGPEWVGGVGHPAYANVPVIVPAPLMVAKVDAAVVEVIVRVPVLAT